MPTGYHISLLLLVVGGVTARAADDAAAEHFEKHVRPILVARCYECHSGQSAKPKGGLLLDSLAAALKGGDTGPAVVPGKTKESLLVDAINYGELYQMPPKSRLPAEEVAVLTKWVESGAVWPADRSQGSGFRVQESGTSFNLAQRKAEHWCWQPVRAGTPPSVKDTAWIRDPLDRFILAKLEERGIAPAAPADKRTLRRRAYFDLVGLPPSGEELEQLLSVAPSSPRPLAPSAANERERGRGGEGETDAFASVVDKLLASPQFGERWGRHWLDLVRYAESRGHEFDYNIPNAFEYRDYVIRALNADVPYDQFLTEHLAGDLLVQPRVHPTERFNESIIGTGFWFLGEWCHSPVDIRKDECDRIDNMLDVFSKTFLGVTVACARCHDHKFDAISQRDYYALAGYLQSASYRLTRFADSHRDGAVAAELTALDGKYRPQIAAAINRALRPRVDELAKTLAAGLADGTTDVGVPETDLRGARVIADYSQPAAGAWMADGPVFGSGPARAGQISLTGDEAAPLKVALTGAAQRDPFWGELGAAEGSEHDSGRLASWRRAGQTLKTPTFTLETGFVHYLIDGVGRAHAVVDSHLMNNGPLHAELLKETGGNSDVPTRWITHDLSRYVGHRVHLEFSPVEDHDFRILQVVEGRDRPTAPVNRPNRLLGHKPVPAVLAETLSLIADDRVAADASPQDRAAVAAWLLAQVSDADLATPQVASLIADYTSGRQALSEKIRRDARLCIAMWEGTPIDESVLIRGNHKTVGPVVQRRLLEALESSGFRVQGSGVGVRGSGFGVQGSETNNRLDLARQLVDARNPLVSRVIVNRVWQHLLGRGIVPSVDNFGVLGQAPTHPELLDYLADEFIRDGWSLKRLIRRIMLSSTYRQSSGVGVQGSGDRRIGVSPVRAEAADPENLLFHRQNLRRLEGETLRDSILAVSGGLDATMYGPSVPIYLTPFMQGRGRPKESGPLDGAGRRSIYVAVRRNFLSPMMLAFDTPIPFTTIGRRNVSNVPAQALILMNDPFVAEQARRWARNVLADPNVTAAERIRRMYQAAYCRPPTDAETAQALAFLEQQSQEHGPPSTAAERDERAWADLGHVLYNVKEFLIVP